MDFSIQVIGFLFGNLKSCFFFPVLCLGKCVYDCIWHTVIIYHPCLCWSKMFVKLLHRQLLHMYIELQVKTLTYISSCNLTMIILHRSELDICSQLDHNVISYLCCRFRFCHLIGNLWIFYVLCFLMMHLQLWKLIKMGHDVSFFFFIIASVWFGAVNKKVKGPCMYTCKIWTFSNMTGAADWVGV